MQVVAGQTAALALKKVKRNQVRKGMVLVDEKAKPKASWEFDADIAILTHSTTIQPRYQVSAQLIRCRHCQIWPIEMHLWVALCKAYGHYMAISQFVHDLLSVCSHHAVLIWLVWQCRQ